VKYHHPTRAWSRVQHLLYELPIGNVSSVALQANVGGGTVGRPVGEHLDFGVAGNVGISKNIVKNGNTLQGSAVQSLPS